MGWGGAYFHLCFFFFCIFNWGKVTLSSRVLVIFYECVWAIADIVQSLTFFSPFLKPPFSLRSVRQCIYILSVPFSLQCYYLQLCRATLVSCPRTCGPQQSGFCFVQRCVTLLCFIFICPTYEMHPCASSSGSLQLGPRVPGTPSCLGCLPFLYIKVFAIILWPESLFFWT